MNIGIHIRKWYYGVVVAMVVFGLGCVTDKQTAATIAQAEQCAIDEPQRALSLMRGVDASMLRSDRDRARYALVYSEACYYNNIDSDSDSLTLSMARYYLDSDIHEERVRALYQHAWVLHNSGRMAEAVTMLGEAERSFEYVDNPRIEGLINRTKGDIYGLDCLFGNALDAYIKARGCFERASLDYHVASVDYDIGVTHMLMREYDSAEQSLLRALNYAYDVDYGEFASVTLHELCDLCIYDDRYDDCRGYVEEFEKRDIPINDLCHYYATLAIVEAAEGDYALAKEYIERAEGAEYVNEEDVEYAHYLVARFSGDMRDALYWQEVSKRRQDKVVLGSLEQPILNVEVESLQRSLAAERRERELTWQRNTAIFVGCAIIVVVLMLFVFSRLNRKNRDIANYVETIRELQLAARAVPEEINATVSALYRDRFSELNHLCDIYYDHLGTSRQKNLVFNRLQDTIETIKCDEHRMKELETAVNKYRCNIMERMRSQVPRLNERDMRVALYLFAGFSNRAIAIFIDSDPSTVSKLRYNIKQKIKSANIEDADEIIAALSDK